MADAGQRPGQRVRKKMQPHAFFSDLRAPYVGLLSKSKVGCFFLSHSQSIDLVVFFKVSKCDNI